jgi:Leucine-rich repeat (LRR) protein
LSGEIPAELGSLSNLESLDLSGNALSGEIPAELGSLSNLIWLYLAGNQLSGCVPSSLEDDLLLFDFSNLGDLPFC